MKNYFLFIAALITISAGCKKDKSEKPVCRISRLINRFDKEMKVTYNADGKLSKIVNTYMDETLTASYTRNSILITRVATSTGTLKSKSFLLLNSSGLINSKRDEYYNAAGTAVASSVKNDFEYNGYQLMKSTLLDSFNRQQSVLTLPINYTWNGDNLISANPATYEVKTYAYYTDKPVQQADMQSIGRIIRGYDVNLYIRNKNLTKSEGSAQITYDFDAEGKVTAVKYNGSIEYRVEYECN